MPPRGDTWRATKDVRPSFRLQYGVRQQCADPVTGSSSMPEPGAKKRETKSQPGVVARLVTMTPRTGSVRSRAKSGVRPVTAASVSSSIR